MPAHRPALRMVWCSQAPKPEADVGVTDKGRDCAGVAFEVASWASSVAVPGNTQDSIQSALCLALCEPERSAMRRVPQKITALTQQRV